MASALESPHGPKSSRRAAYILATLQYSLRNFTPTPTPDAKLQLGVKGQPCGFEAHPLAVLLFLKTSVLLKTKIQMLRPKNHTEICDYAT
ncbi:hypothetical protein E2320_018203, partial [Naja naja]